MVGVAGFEPIEQILHPTSVYTSSSLNWIGKIDKYANKSALILLRELRLTTLKSSQNTLDSYYLFIKYKINKIIKWK